MADNGHLENKINCDISKSIWLIMMKFCVMTRKSSRAYQLFKKIKFLKIPR